MLSNSLNSQNQKTFSFPTYINKTTPYKSKINKRYSNVQNKSSAPIAYNIHNNQFLYKSENKKGYNQITIPSFSKNNDILFINPNTYTTISKGNISSQNSLNWNNIGFKDIKYKNNNNFVSSTYKPNVTTKNNLFSSYNLSNNYGATAKNLGFYNMNSNNNSKKYSKYNNNLLYSKKTGLMNSYGSTLTNSSNSYNNVQKKDSLLDYYKNIIQIKNARQGLNSKVIKDRMNNEDNIKKINKIQAVWKGIYVRELMSYYWNFYQFQKLLEKFLNNQYKKKFLMNLKKKDLVGDLNKKNREYNNLVNEYNKIMKQFNDYKKKIEKNKSNKNKLIVEKKEDFDIVNNKRINSNQEEKENTKLKLVNKKRDNENLKIINNDNIIYEKIKKENIYEINHTFFSIICRLEKENKGNIETKRKEQEKDIIFTIENQKGFNYEQNKLFDSEDLYMDKNSHLNIASSKINEQKEINCCTNERFPIFGNIELKNKQEIKNIQKNENKKEKENKTLSLLISNQNNFIIKNDEKKICYKTTETEKKINLMNPNKSSELLFKGIKTSNKNKKDQVFKKENNSIEIKCVQNKKDKIFKKENNFIEIKSVPNKKKKIFKKENNFIEIKGNKIANEQILKTENNSIELNPDNNKKEQILKTENNFIELKKVPKSQILTKENNYIEFKPEKINKKIITNYNLTNEIEKGDALEINPYEIKRTKDPNKISQQDNLQVLSFTEKSKLNLAKTIFLIKFKKILVEYIKKIYFPDFQNELKKIALMHALNKIKKNYEKKTKKIGLKNLKEITMIIKIKKYFKVEMEKYEMKKLIKKYLVKKWYNGLLDLSKIIINNKK